MNGGRSWNSRMGGAVAFLWVVGSGLLASPGAPPQTTDDQRVQLRVDTSEADSVLAVIAKRQTGEPVSDEDWRKLFATEPYRRLKSREAEMQRPFTDESFQGFVFSDDLAGRAAQLRQTLDEWTSRDLKSSARRVLAYLPPEARIRATVYPVIKPKSNSFVYDPAGDAAIFLYLNPERSPEQFENTVAHELHHIGFASIEQRQESILSALPSNVRRSVEWMGAFGEGFAMLAAAGDPDSHPHAVSPAADRARWDRDMANFNLDVGKLEAFFLDVIEGRLSSDDEIRQRGFAFFGEQGAWYTVGYRMAVVVERRFGREALIASMVDPRQLLARYNEAAKELNEKGEPHLTLWSPRLLQKIGAE